MENAPPPDEHDAATAQQGTPPQYPPPPFPDPAGQTPPQYAPPPQQPPPVGYAPPQYVQPPPPQQPPYGYPPPGYGYPPPPSAGTNGLAIASFVLALCWLWGLGAILGLVFGYMGKSQIDRSGGVQGGGGLAIAGIVLGWIGIAISIVLTIALISAVGDTSSYSDY